MDLFRLTVVAMIVLVLTGALGLGTVVRTSHETVLKPEFVTTALDESGSYEAMAETGTMATGLFPVDEDAAGPLSNASARAESHENDTLRGALAATMTPEYVKSQVEPNVYRMYAYLHGNRAEPNLTLDLRPLKENLSTVDFGGENLTTGGLNASDFESAGGNATGNRSLNGTDIQSLNGTGAQSLNGTGELPPTSPAGLANELPDTVLLTAGMTDVERQGFARMASTVRWYDRLSVLLLLGIVGLLGGLWWATRTAGGFFAAAGVSAFVAGVPNFVLAGPVADVVFALWPLADHDMVIARFTVFVTRGIAEVHATQSRHLVVAGTGLFALGLIVVAVERILGISGFDGAASRPALAEEPDYGGWLADANDYDGTVDWRGEDEVVVRVGEGSLSFDPAAVAVSPGTTVTWEWAETGGERNVVSRDGGPLASATTADGGHTFSYEFDRPGTHLYACSTYESTGMKGAVYVTKRDEDTGQPTR